MLVEVFPLGEGGVARGAVEIACHPGIDDVVDVIKLGWAHQISGAIKVWERSQVRGGETTVDAAGVLVIIKAGFLLSAVESALLRVQSSSG